MVDSEEAMELCSSQAIIYSHVEPPGPLQWSFALWMRRRVASASTILFSRERLRVC